jgi:hypothetical protein
LDNSRQKEQGAPLKNDQSAAAKPLTYSVPEAGRMAGLSRNSAYLAALRGEIPTISFGRLLRVPAAAWDRILTEGRPPPKPPSRDLPRR